MTTNNKLESAYDAIVIGAGAGGLSAAAWLCSSGKKVLLLEEKDRVGGRATSYEIEGFTVNEGAIAIELGSTFEETMTAVGKKVDVREPSPATVFRVDGKIINPAKGGWGMLLGTMTKSASKIGAKLSEARDGNLPDGRISTADWLSGITKNKTVHNLFRNFCAAIWAANADELPARAFLTYFAQKGAFKRFGFCPRGTIGVWQDMAEGIQDKGGQVELNAKVISINTEDNQANSVTVDIDGERHTVKTQAVVCNGGPTLTAQLLGDDALPKSYLDELDATIKPATNIVINFASQERLLDVPGLVTFANTTRLCNMGELTATCPELAPEGWYLYVAYAVPRPSLSAFNEEQEIENSLNDLRMEFPDFDTRAKLLNVRVMTGGWPAQRSCSGYDMPTATPIKNVWNVGDGVKDYGDAGTQSCALTGKSVASEVEAYLTK